MAEYVRLVEIILKNDVIQTIIVEGYKTKDNKKKVLKNSIGVIIILKSFRSHLA